MSVGTYVRCVGAQWESGAIICTDKGALRNPVGLFPSYEDACKSVNMATSGQPQHGTPYKPPQWRYA